MAPVAFTSPHAVQPAPDPGASPQTRKLFSECKQFESILISNLWSDMEQGVGIADNAADPGAATMQGLGIQSAAMGLASAGGLGIARMIYQELAPRLLHAQRGASSGAEQQKPESN